METPGEQVDPNDWDVNSLQGARYCEIQCMYTANDRAVSLELHNLLGWLVDND